MCVNYIFTFARLDSPFGS
uniref:Uncharacterized protein n=1 Tax=Arundo donax TaxID=35708 RepID=A0A0A9AKK3_ARUDO